MASLIYLSRIFMKTLLCGRSTTEKPSEKLVKKVCVCPPAPVRAGVTEPIFWFYKMLQNAGKIPQKTDGEKLEFATETL